MSFISLEDRPGLCPCRSVSCVQTVNWAHNLVCVQNVVTSLHGLTVSPAVVKTKHSPTFQVPRNILEVSFHTNALIGRTVSKEK